jgi:hypothetical protein
MSDRIDPAYRDVLIRRTSNERLEARDVAILKRAATSYDHATGDDVAMRALERVVVRLEDRRRSR